MNKLKQRIKKVIQYLKIGMLTDALRFQYERINNYRENKQFIKENPNLRLPKPFMIYETFRLNYRRYIAAGLEDAKWLIDEIKPYCDIARLNVLDWGCGPGRVVRHLPSLLSTESKVWACDYNEAYVRWCESNLNGIEFFKNELSPPLILPDRLLDFIYGLSIFTHLSEEKHYLWINEMHRLLRDEGILLITTHGEITKQNLVGDEIRKFDDGELVVRGNIKEGYRVYCAYHPIPFMERLFAGKFIILKHRAGKRQEWGLQQDLWILRKISH